MHTMHIIIVKRLSVASIRRNCIIKICILYIIIPAYVIINGIERKGVKKKNVTSRHSPLYNNNTIITLNERGKVKFINGTNLLFYSSTHTPSEPLSVSALGLIYFISPFQTINSRNRLSLYIFVQLYF